MLSRLKLTRGGRSSRRGGRGKFKDAAEDGRPRTQRMDSGQEAVDSDARAVTCRAGPPTSD